MRVQEIDLGVRKNSPIKIIGHCKLVESQLWAYF